MECLNKKSSLIKQEIRWKHFCFILFNNGGCYLLNICWKPMEFLNVKNLNANTFLQYFVILMETIKYPWFIVSVPLRH